MSSTPDVGVVEETRKEEQERVIYSCLLSLQSTLPLDHETIGNLHQTGIPRLFRIPSNLLQLFRELRKCNCIFLFETVT
jgi:hypothetical protein